VASAPTTKSNNNLNQKKNENEQERKEKKQHNNFKTINTRENLIKKSFPKQF
jgi:hypothetical protein